MALILTESPIRPFFPSHGKHMSATPANGQTDNHASTRKVMIIDDSATIRKTARIFLDEAGYAAVLADDGFDALAKIVDQAPAVIFCDILMPRLDGYQTCALIKRNPRFGSTPVVMLSSRDGLFDRVRGRLAGSDAHLAKPFTRESLLAALARHCSPCPVAAS